MLGVLVGLTCLVAITPRSASAITFDFETDLGGWTAFDTDNGTIGSLNRVNDSNGVPGWAAQVNVGTFTLTEFEGGGIRRNFEFNGSPVDISADIATFKIPKNGVPPAIDDNHGGLFELLVDGLVVASSDFGFVLSNQTFFASISASQLAISAGIHEIAFLITRPFRNDVGVNLNDPLHGPSPREYIDNIVISQASNIPEPGSLWLVGMALVGSLALRRRA